MGLKLTEPTLYTWVCSHGKTLGEPCRECDIARAKEIVRQWGDEVDLARKIIGNRLHFDRLFEQLDVLEMSLRPRK
ncbi:MAG TPA: hypothetical protein VF447_00130 [Terriglobales bacterium]